MIVENEEKGARVYGLNLEGRLMYGTLLELQGSYPSTQRVCQARKWWDPSRHKRKPSMMWRQPKDDANARYVRLFRGHVSLHGSSSRHHCRATTRGACWCRTKQGSEYRGKIASRK